MGVTGTGGLGLDWANVIARKNQIVSRWSARKAKGLERKGIAVLRGQARFIGHDELTIEGRRVAAQRIVVANGSSPARPPIPRIEHALTSTALLDLLTRPQRLIVVGGGYIGMAFAFVGGRADTSATVPQSGPHVLPGVRSGTCC